MTQRNLILKIAADIFLGRIDGHAAAAGRGLIP